MDINGNGNNVDAKCGEVLDYLERTWKAKQQHAVLVDAWVGMSSRHSVLPLPSEDQVKDWFIVVDPECLWCAAFCIVSCFPVLMTSDTGNGYSIVPLQQQFFSRGWWQCDLESHARIPFPWRSLPQLR